MTSTAEHLKQITDRSLFERICNAILRFKFPELTNLIEGGINEKGETIKGKLDAFCNISSDEFVLVEHTTDANLKSKWLYDRVNYRGKKSKPDKDNGDLIKSIQEAAKLKAIYPKARFKVYLTTNQNVSSELWTEVMAKAGQADVIVQLVELKTLADFLDNNPDGQYLRKKFLGISTELLSGSLFRDIQKLSLELYAQECFIERSTLLDSWNLDTLSSRVISSSRQLLLLLAESGFGKSTLCYNYFSDKLSQGDHALRINATTIATANTLPEAIDAVIKQLSPGIFLNSQSRQLVLNAKPTIIVDDINNASEPMKLLDKLVSWSMTSENSEWSGLKLICPVWPGYLAQLPDKLKKEDYYDYLILDKPTLLIAITMASKWLADKQIVLSELALEELVNRSGRDPLLINLAVRLVKPDSLGSVNYGDQVLRTFIYDKIESSLTKGNIPDAKKLMLIQDLGLTLLLNESIYPSYRELVDWCAASSDLVTLIDGLASRRDLLYFNNDNSLRYRHDRIRDFIVKEGLAKALDNFDAHTELLSDPYYARLLGQAIAEAEIGSSDVERMINIAPQAVFNSLRYLQVNGTEAKNNIVMNVIQEWHQSDGYKVVHPAVFKEISNDIETIDMANIGQLMEVLPNSHSLIAARLRNGDARGGIAFMLSHLGIEPALNYRYRDLLIEHVKAFHLDAVISQLKILFETHTLTEDGLKGTLLFCGYLRDSRLVEPLIGYWNRNLNDEALGYYAWALVNCFDQATAEPAFGVLDCFMQLPNERPEESNFPRGIRNTTLNTFARVAWNIENDQIQLLAENYLRFQPLVTSVFHHLDHPDAMKIIVDNIATNLERAHPHSSYALFNPGDRWNYEKNGRRLSTETLSFLQLYWQDQSNSQKKREVSFHFWTDNVASETSIMLLQQVEEDDKLYHKTLINRVLLGDQSAATKFIEQVWKNYFLVQLIRYIWNAECKQFYREFFAARQEEHEKTELLHILVDILKNIPQPDAEELIIEFWAIIQDELFGVQIALYIATPETKRLAAEKIGESKNTEELFVYIDHTFQFLMKEEAQISLEKLEAIQPYISYINKNSLVSIANRCMLIGFSSWAEKEVAPYLEEEERVRIWPTAFDLATKLKSDITLDRSHFWLHEISSDGRPHVQIVNALEIFSTQITNDAEFQILGSIIGEIGTRKDLQILLGIPNSVVLDEVKRALVIEGAKYAVYSRVPW